MKTVLLKTTMKKMRVNNYDGPVELGLDPDSNVTSYNEMMAHLAT